MSSRSPPRQGCLKVAGRSPVTFRRRRHGQGRGITLSKKWEYSGGDNAVLKLILLELWNSKCYRCDEPKAYTDVQIDHIIPKSTSTARLLEIQQKLGLAPDFHIHDPRNLGPICARCNGKRGKSDRDYSDVPRTMDVLHRAESLRPKVIELVDNFSKSGDVAKALLKANASNLKDDKVRGAFERHAPALVQKLALLDEGKVEFQTVRTRDVEIESDVIELRSSLSTRGRTSLAVLEEICGGDFWDLTQEGLAELLGELMAELRHKFEDLEEDLRTEVGSQDISFAELSISSLDAKRTADSVNFRFAGTLELQTTCSILRESWDGALEALQGDAYLYLRVERSAAWYLSSIAEGVQAENYKIVEWLEEELDAAP